jgi:hypothetical protein
VVQNPTPYPDINDLLVALLANQQAVLGDRLIGLYLYGSLVWGDFDYTISDIDMTAVITTELTPQEAAAIQQMHERFAKDHLQWDNRIEVQYQSLHGLRMFKTESSNMGNISPGEPFHIIQAGKEWIMNWFFIQEYGVTLFGPPPSTIIEPISKAEFIQTVKEHAGFWRDYILQKKDSPRYQAYAILTMCRALYTVTTGKQVSKKQAALWAAEQFPERATLITNALMSRSDPRDNMATYDETVEFVHFMIDKVLATN